MSRFAADVALGLETLERVVGYGSAARERARARTEALAQIAHPGVLAPIELRRGEDDAVVAVMPRVDGDDVATLVAARGGLRAGECVTLGIGAATALAAMHKAGLAHGDVSLSNIMVSATAVTLVDTMGAVAAEEGTPGYQAPERTEGASAPGDVYALACVLRAAVRDADADRIEAWVQPMLAPDPAVRPSAAMVARALESCAAPEPIERPMIGIAGAMRARAASTHLPKTVRREHGRPWRVQRQVRRWGTVLGLAGLVAVLVPAVGARLLAGAHDALQATAGPARAQGLDQPMPVPAHAAVSPQIAAAELTQARFAAISVGDADALRATTAAGSAAREEVEALAQALAEGDLRVEGLAVTVVEARTVRQEGREAAVKVRYTVSGHTVWDASGAAAYEGYTQTVTLELTWDEEAGWQVCAVSAASGG